MKKVIPNVLTEKEAKYIIEESRKRNFSTNSLNSVNGPSYKESDKEKNIFKKIRNIIENEIGAIDWQKPSYVRVERNGKHGWHFDTGAKAGNYGKGGHMQWCDYGCSILLTQGDCGELEYRDGTKLNHYLDLAIHTSDEEHRITKYKGERVTILAFMRSLK